jgi:hypothetical protein
VPNDDHVKQPFGCRARDLLLLGKYEARPRRFWQPRNMGKSLSRGLPHGYKLKALLAVSFASQNTAGTFYVREITNDRINTLESSLGTIL